MGMVLGKITIETPKYEVIRAAPDYEIGKYFPRVVAEVIYGPSKFRNDRDGGFIIQANYIGALGDPQNVRPEKIAMTAPVVTRSGGAVTVQFVLPSKYGVASDEVAAERVQQLRRSLERGGHKVVGDFLLARHNPPWTLPPLPHQRSHASRTMVSLHTSHSSSTTSSSLSYYMVKRRR
ncbi:unnamed protein product [Musa textilis]